MGITVTAIPDRLVHGHLGAWLPPLGAVVWHPRRYLVPVFADLDTMLRGAVWLKEFGIVGLLLAAMGIITISGCIYRLRKRVI